MNDTRKRIQQLTHKVLDGLDQVLDQLTPMPANRPQPAVARRLTANTLGLFRLCANSTCRRARCCRGEPLPACASPCRCCRRTWSPTS